MMNLKVETILENPEAGSFVLTAAGKPLSDCSELELQDEADRLADELCKVEKELKNILMKIQLCYRYASLRSQ